MSVALEATTMTVLPVTHALDDGQRQRIEILENTNEYGSVKRILSERHRRFLVYGGMAQLIEQRGRLVDDGDLDRVDRVTTGIGVASDGSIDWRRNGDVDIMVDDIGDVEQLARDLMGIEGVNIEIVGGDYPRIDIFREGVEIMSISDLKSSAKAVRRIAGMVGRTDVTDDQDDERVYFGSRLIQNLQNPIVVTSETNEIRQYSRADNVPNLVWNWDSVYSPEMVEVLIENGGDGAREVVREYAYWVGKAIFMSATGVNNYDVAERTRLAMVTRRLANVARNMPESVETLENRVSRAVEIDYLWTVRTIYETGAMWWISPTLAQEIETKIVDRWRFVSESMIGRSEGRNWSGFVDRLMLGLGVEIDKREVIMDEIKQNWTVTPSKRVAKYTPV